MLRDLRKWWNNLREERERERTEQEFLAGVLALHVRMLESSGEQDSVGTAERMLALAKARKRHQAFELTGAGAGARLLEWARMSDEARAYVDACRAEAVRDEDFETWWSLREVERQMAREVDNYFASQAMHCEIESGVENGRVEIGLSAPAARVLKNRPTFAYPPFEQAEIGVAGYVNPNPSGNDRPLPYELKDRVNAWVERTVKTGRSPSLPAAYSSFNAYVRDLIRRGEL